MSYLGKFLLCKHEELNVGPQHSQKKNWMPIISVLERQRWVGIPGAFWPTSLAESLLLRLSERP